MPCGCKHKKGSGMYIRGGGYKKRKRGSGNLGRSKSTWTPSYLLNRFSPILKKGSGMSFRGGSMNFSGSGMSFRGGGMKRVFARRGSGKRMI